MWSTTTAAPQTPYVNHELRFGFTPPAGWLQRPGDPTSNLIVAFVEPGAQPRPAPVPDVSRESNEEFLRRVQRRLKEPVGQSAALQANISVIAAPAGAMTLDEYAKETRERAQKATRDQKAKGGTTAFQILSEKPRRLAGVAAVERLILVRSASGPRIRTREVICIQGDRLFTITLAAPEGSLTRANREFERTLASFVWKG